MLNEGKPFTPVFTLGILGLLSSQHLANAGYWLRAGLAHAGRVGEITIAVDPFDMTFVPFQAVAGLFPLCTSWTAETWELTYAWWAAFVVAIAAVVWPELFGGCLRLFQKVLDAVGKRHTRLPSD